MSDVEASETGHAQGAPAAQRGRGRPAGSLNRSTLAKRAAAEASAAVDESVSIKNLEMPMETIEEADDEAAPATKPKRASRKKIAPPSETVPEPPEPETVPEPEPVPQPPQAPRSAQGARPASLAIPDRTPAKRAPRKPRAPAAAAAPALLHEASLLDIMRAGLEHARTKHKRDRVAQYDAMFAY